ncbi:hypothetical protein [Tautonia rosea]|uniref:hypothetical protein n=1 Tax=Tautonia rosea TaxID=2728037 RepID=UPI0014759E43|nr:hypothetical protein [Tautonia rosea]
MAPAPPPEVQTFRVSCPEGHVIRGRRLEGYQALRCPECGLGVFVLPSSPLPMPPMPAARVDPNQQAGVGFDEAPIPLSDHVPDPMHEAAEVEWLEPVDSTGESLPGGLSGFDPVEAAVSELPTSEKRPPAGNRQAPASDRPSIREPRPSRRDQPQPVRPQRSDQPDVHFGRQILIPARPGLRERVRRNRPLLVASAVVLVLGGTVFWTIVQNQRRNAPVLVQQGRDEGIPALDRGDFDQAYRILSRAAEAVESLRGQIRGADEVRQAAREAAIFVDLIPDRLEMILDQRARSSDESEWQATFDRSYKGRAILISAQVTATPADSAGRYELNYRILSEGPIAPREARIDFEGFRLFEISEPEVGWQIQFGARLAAVESEPNGWRFRLEPNSGVTMTHQEAIRSLGWTPVETASLPPNSIREHRFSPLLLTTLLSPPPRQDLRGETPDQILQRLGAPRSFARSASQGEYLEQWIYDAPSGARQYLNFLRSTGRSGPAVVAQDFYLR